MDYQLLFNEIGQPQYAGMTDVEIVAALNAQTPVRRHVPARDLIATAVLNGVYAAIDAGSDSENVQMRGLCRSVLAILHLPDQTVNLDDPRVAQMFGALRQVGVITAQQAAAIDALATTGYTSRARALGLGAVTVEDIERSRIVPQLDALRMRLAAGYNQAVALLDAADDVPTWDDLMTVLQAA